MSASTLPSNRVEPKRAGIIAVIFMGYKDRFSSYWRFSPFVKAGRTTLHKLGGGVKRGRKLCQYTGRGGFTLECKKGPCSLHSPFPLNQTGSYHSLNYVKRSRDP